MKGRPASGFRPKPEGCVCIVDFVGQSGGITTTFSADWDKGKKHAVFSGEWAEVMPLEAKRRPTERQVFCYVASQAKQLGYQPAGTVTATKE